MKRILLYLFILLFSLNVTYAAIDDAEIYYSFDDSTISGTNVQDIAGNNDNATLVAGAKDGVDGILLDAVQTDNTNDYVDLGNLQSKTIRTISWWFNANATGGYNGNDAMFGTIVDGSNFFNINAVGGTGVSYQLRVGGSVKAASTVAHPYSFDTWYHYALVLNGSHSVLYRNGTIVDTYVTTETDYMQINTNTYLGWQSFNNVFLGGVFDEIAMYSDAKTSSEIQQLYNSGVGFNPYNTAVILTNLSSIYSQDTFSLSVTTPGDLVNMSYVLDSNPEISIATNSNSSTLLLEDISIGEHSIGFKSISDAGTYWTNQTFEIQPYLYFRFNDTSTGFLLENYTFGGVQSVGNLVSIDARLYSGNTSLTFSKLGYETSSFYINFEPTLQINTTYNVAPAEININIKDQDTGSIITGENFSIDLVGTLGIQTSTITGTKTITNTFLSLQEYLLIVSSENYETETITFDFTNTETIELNVYVINSSDSNLGSVFVKPVDTFGNAIPGLRVKALQWFSSSSSYVEVGTSTTGSDGLGTLNVLLNDKIYIFSATQNGNTAYSAAEIIDSTENGKTITISISPSAQEFTYLFENLFTQVTESFNNNTNVSTVTFVWSNSEGLSNNICINSYRVIRGYETMLTNNCTTGASGLYQLAFNINNSYTTLIKGEVLVDGVYYPVNTFTYLPENNVPDLLESIGLDVFIVPLLFLGSIALAMFIQNAIIGTITLMISAGLSLFLAPDVLTQAIVAFLFFMGFLTINFGVKSR